MRWILALVLAAGCAEGMAVGDAPVQGDPHPDAAGADAGPGVDVTPPPTCDVPIATLNGMADYVPQSLKALDPEYKPAGLSGKTCGEYVAANASTFAPAKLPIIDGLVGGSNCTCSTQFVSESTGAGVCVYLFTMTDPGDASRPCAMASSYNLSLVW